MFHGKCGTVDFEKKIGVNFIAQLVNFQKNVYEFHYSA